MVMSQRDFFPPISPDALSLLARAYRRHVLSAVALLRLDEMRTQQVGGGTGWLLSARGVVGRQCGTWLPPRSWK